MNLSGERKFMNIDFDFENIKDFIFLDGETPEERQLQASSIEYFLIKDGKKSSISQIGCDGWRKWILIDKKNNSFLLNHDFLKDHKKIKKSWKSASQFLEENKIILFSIFELKEYHNKDKESFK